MYKLLLSWRYLRTRYLALASIISVMLGVATLIVVNSVMGGFATKLKERLRGLQAHVLVESRSFDGFYDYENAMKRVREALGDKLEAISPVIETFAILQFRWHSEVIVRPVRLIGVDPESKSQASQFGTYLMNPEFRNHPARCFSLEGEAAERFRWYQAQALENDTIRKTPTNPDEPPPVAPAKPPEDVVRIYGVIVGHGIATYRNPGAKVGDPDKDIQVLKPGDTIRLMSITRMELDGHDGTRGYPRPVAVDVAITDTFRSDMSEYDSNIVYIHIKDLERMRAMTNRATELQIKLKDYEHDKKEVVGTLEKLFHASMFQVQTWEKKQGPLLAAIDIERGLLNVLLFLIIAVAGFGILAIFFMIVVEKTKDIGILKSLGASNQGVMGIFLSYGFALGLVGAGLGTFFGLLITYNINPIEEFITKMTGQQVFDRGVYYFDRIPTDIQLNSVFFVNLGAIVIAVGASVFPSLRAALLHPVRALRYE